MKIETTKLLLKYKNLLTISRPKIRKNSIRTYYICMYLFWVTMYILLMNIRMNVFIFNILLFVIGIFLVYTYQRITDFLIGKIITPLLTLPLIKISKDIEGLMNKINNTINLIQDMDEILAFLDHLQKILKFLTVYKFLFRFLVGVNIEDIFEETKIWVMGVLRDLKSDLNAQIYNQQSILKTAKSEVEIHIQGTTELNQVSELQKVRLDKQIEQFEELQKVIVKI